MALSFDDEHLNSADKNYNKDNKKFNGGVDGVAKKWEKAHATKHSYNAAGGASMSRKQGTGELGRAATVPSEGTDTTKMSPEEKFRYMQALGMLPGSEPPAPQQQEPSFKMKSNRPFRR